jgi:hypothetical protein
MALSLPTPPVLPALRSEDGTARLGVVTDATAEAIAALLAYAQALAASLATADAAQTEARQTADAAETSARQSSDSALQTQVNAKAPLASPALTGAPTAPTPTSGSAAGQIATKGYVDSTASSAASGATSGLAPLNSPAFTGNPTAPTQSAGNNSTRLATTAFVQTAIAGVSGGGGSLSIPGPYDSDAAAASGGVAVGSLYYRSSGSVYKRLA